MTFRDEGATMIPSFARRFAAAPALLAAVLALACAVALRAVPATAQGARPDPAVILAEVKAVTGGKAWDALASQHSRVAMKLGDATGSAERWASLATGRSLLRYEIGPVRGAQGFDGFVAWSQDASGQVRIEGDDDARELAANAAYRDRLAFWYPERQPAVIEYARRDAADGAEFEVLRITPEGGRAYEVWVNLLTRRIERLAENEGPQTRTEVYSDFRPVQGVSIPWKVHATRGDPRQSDEFTITAIDYNAPLDGIEFGVPAPPPDDFRFPLGKDSVEVPFVERSGHLFVDVRLNGKGPFRMLFDAGGLNVILPGAMKTLNLRAEGAPAAGEAKEVAGLVKVDRLEIGGVTVDRQVFAAVDLAGLMRRVEGVDDVAGIVGFELLRRFPARIDYANSKLVFYRPETFRYAGRGTRVPFVFGDHVPNVRGRVDGIEGAFQIDTGARTSLALSAPFVERNSLAAKYGAKREVISGAGVAGPTRALLARAAVLELGDAQVKAPVTFLSRQASGALANPALAGIVGFGVLRQFDITFDYAARQLFLEPNANHGKADAHDRAGLWLERGERGIEVIEVVPDSPASAVGLRAGDLVVAVDGKAVSLPDLRALLRGAPGTKVRLRVAAGGAGKAAKDVVVTLKDLV
jgi:predicted aspartyl protease